MIVATSGEVGTLARLDAATGALLWREDYGGIHSGIGPVSPSLRFVVMGGEQGPSTVREHPGGRIVWSIPPGALALAVSDGGVVLVAREKGIDLIDARQGRIMRHLPEPGRGVTAGAISADGHLVLLGGRDGSIRIWDLDTGRESGRVDLASSTDRATALAWGPQARSFVAGTARGVVLRFERGSGTAPHR